MTTQIEEGRTIGGPPADGQGAQAPPSAATTRWKIERRPHVSTAWQIASIAIALFAAFVVSSLLILSAQVSLTEAYLALLNGAFGGWVAAAETLVQSTPLIFTGLAVMVAFRGRVWNIGAEGQFFAGTMAVIWVVNVLGEREVPSVVYIVLIVVVALIAGAIWGGIAGFLKARYGANEIIVTVMMNFVILSGLSFLLSEPWRDPNSFYYQTALIPDAANFPRLFPRVRLHLGTALALLAGVVVYFLVWKTTLGYEIRAMGINPEASSYKGINVARTTVVILAISGAIAALAGASEVAGLHYRLRLDISTGYGFTGIIIAMLGRLHPVGVILAAIFFGALVNGSTGMQITTGVPVALVDAIQGITLLFLLTAEVLSRYRIRRITAHV